MTISEYKSKFCKECVFRVCSGISGDPVKEIANDYSYDEYEDYEDDGL